MVNFRIIGIKGQKRHIEKRFRSGKAVHEHAGRQAVAQKATVGKVGGSWRWKGWLGSDADLEEINRECKN